MVDRFARRRIRVGDAEACEDAYFQAFHVLGLLVALMVVAEQMQNSVHDQMLHVVLDRQIEIGRLAPQRVTEAVDRLDELETGVVSSRKNSLTQEIEKMADSIQRKEDELAAYEARLRLQYAGLDRLLRQLQSQADFLRTRIS